MNQRPPSLLSLLALCIATLSTLAQPAPPPATGPTTQPITPAKSPVGDLLRKWWAEGTAAGNVGDVYDNRDRTHSELDRKPHPQLVKHEYTKEELDRRFDWAAQRVLLRGIVFGNSSTSAGITQGGSNVRMYYSQRAGLDFLYQQYAHNNVYMYPEHQDHDPGHNGVLPDGSPGGYGDVYPTNTPYLITSQGSSGSDQPFMHAVPYTLAAFRPEVKRRLAETGLLMPTVQMILRSSMKTVKEPADYFKPLAHPTVFEGSDNIDDLKLVNAAHAITLETIPPMIQLQVVEESKFENGVDYFDVAGTVEKHADTPCSISRIWRAAAGRRRIVISAEKSYDLNNRPLEFRWVLLRGDEKHVTIKPLNDAKSKAEITLDYFARGPIAPGSPLESNRVDIGAFVGNGANWSAPAFVTYFTIDSESRVYDDKGRIAEIGYGVGGPQMKVANWPALFDALAAEKPTPGVALLKITLKPDELAALLKLAPAHKERSASKDEKVKTEARDLLEKPQPGLTTPAKRLLETTLQKLADNPRMIVDQQAVFRAAFEADPATAAKYEKARARLLRAGTLTDEFQRSATLLDTFPPGRQFSGYEASEIRRFNAEVLSQILLPAIASSQDVTNYVDPNIARPKSWRDVYHYNGAGELTGWTRHGLDKLYEFTAKGQLILARDPAGLPTKTTAVSYDQLDNSNPQRGPNWNPLKQIVFREK